MIVINGKEYRNIQEQVQKNMEDIEELQEQFDDGYYTKEESLNIFQTKIGMELYATQRQLNLNIAATEARTDVLLANKQDTLVSGTNIKTVNGNSLVGSGNINIGTSYTAGYGIGIANDVISIDQNTVATTSLLNGYIKDNDTNYSATFRGKAVWIKAEGAYTATSYGDGAIARSVPHQPGYEYDLPNKSGTFALLDDIPAAVSGVNNGTNWTSITIGNDTYGIPTGGGGSIVAGTGIDITNGVISVDSDTVVTKDSNGNVNGILQVAHLQSEDWDEDDDCKADIYLNSGLRSSTIVLDTDGEESGSSITLSGTTSVGSYGTITADAGSITLITHGSRIFQKDAASDTYVNEVAYLDDLDERETRKYELAINIGTLSRRFIKTFYADQGAYPTGTISDPLTALNYVNIGDIFYNTDDSCIYTFGGAGQTIFMRKYDGTYYSINEQYPPVQAITITITQLD